MVLSLLSGCGWFSDGGMELPEQASPCSAWPEAGMYRVTVPGYARRPWVSVPPDRGRRDGVIVLHGAGGSSQRMLSNTTFRSEALRRGMLAVFPDGSGDAERYYGYTWNAGGCCGRARKKKADDLGFLQALSETLRSRMCLDRLLVTGHSNGAMMAHRWACEGSGPDALFTVSGPPVVSTCDGSPLPTLAWHGTADPVVPFHGGPIELGDDLPDVQEAFDLVRDRNRCELERAYIASEGDLTCETWRCDVPTTFCAIDGWGHVWPGGRGDRDRGPGAEEIGMSWFDLRVADQAR